MEIKKIDLEKMDKALELTWKTFLEYEVPDYSQEGIDEFKKTIDDEQWLSAREFYGAYEADELLGLIATKDKSHIALFFVDGKHHRKGIGRKLFEKVLEENDKNFFTVNSSPYAKEVYEHLGFECTDDLQCINGLKFYPMTMKVKRLTR